MMGGGWDWGWGMGGLDLLAGGGFARPWFGFPCGASPKFLNRISTRLAKQLHRLICFASNTTCAVLKRFRANF
jgi:hypothetical protein